MEGRTKEVYFDQYCEDCKYYNTEDGDDPCNDCLAQPYNEYSHKPVYFEEN